MIVKEAQFETCDCCNARKRISETVYGCDECCLEIDLNQSGRQYLDLTVHRHEGDAQHLQFCSWRCCMAGVKKVRTDYFVSLPLLLFDCDTPGLRPQDFFAELTQGRRP